MFTLIDAIGIVHPTTTQTTLGSEESPRSPRACFTHECVL